jgi:hypothetical protein
MIVQSATYIKMNTLDMPSALCKHEKLNLKLDFVKNTVCCLSDVKSHLQSAFIDFHLLCCTYLYLLLAQIKDYFVIT